MASRSAAVFPYIPDVSGKVDRRAFTVWRSHAERRILRKTK
jgi:hypothetical protein